MSTGALGRATERPRWTRCAVVAALVLLAAGSATLAACGGDDGDDEDEIAARPAAGFESSYCVTARKWAAHELDGGGDGAYARGGPPALEKWWNEQLAYLKTSLRQAPSAIRRAEAINERAIRTKLTPLVRKYGFDFKRVQAEASPAEQAFALSPPPEVAKAQAARNLYQNRVCGYGGNPPAAQVKFTGGAVAKPYCQAVVAQKRSQDEVSSAGFDPQAFRAYARSESLSRALSRQEATAPDPIAPDVKAENEWTRSRSFDVLEKFDYDLRRLLLEGSAEDIAAFTYWDPAIRRQNSRVTAYQQQVCGL